MGPPANLPGFTKLAREIAGGKLGWKDEYAADLDKYLGRAERSQVDVQARARSVLSVEGVHTPLHEHLLGIFGSPERVRLITTNFDPHFAVAATTVFPGARLPQYIGPALPPGHRFRGIAQLHGSLGHREDRLVLTDRDFADAYMAEGWAARFLTRVFADRTVLFVGYSLTDPIMRYLLHAIPATGRWYGLWHVDEATQGAEHDIVPVTFADSRSGDRYGDLNEGIKRWQWYARAAPSGHDAELRRLFALGPPTSPLDADYLRARLRTEEGRLIFWNTATQQSWFEWAAAERLLDGLVEAQGTDPHTGAWAQWCLAHFFGSCKGPWTATVNARIGLPWRFIGSSLAGQRRMGASLYLTNPLAAVDRIVNGRELRGWGGAAYPDPTLYAVTGFDPATERFQYRVNPRFGSTAPARSTLRTPFRVTLDIVIDLGRPTAEQQVLKFLEPGRTRPGRMLDSTELRQRYRRMTPNVYQWTLALSDSLLLSPAQVRELRAAEAAYLQDVDRLWGGLAAEFARLPREFDGRAALRRQEETAAAGVELNRQGARRTREILSALQFSLADRRVQVLVTPSMAPGYNRSY